MNKCDIIQKLINRLIDKETVSNEEKKNINEHIQKCQKCYNVYEFNLKLKENVSIDYYPKHSKEIISKIESKIQDVDYNNDIVYSFIKRLTLVPVSLVIILAIVWFADVQSNYISLDENLFITELTDIEQTILKNNITRESVLNLVFDDSSLGG